MLLKAKYWILFALILVASSACLYRAQKTQAQTGHATPQHLINLEQVMNTEPIWAYDFEQGWNAEHGKGGLKNQSSAAKKWRYAQMQSNEAGQVIIDPASKRNHVMKFLWQKNKGKKFDDNTQKKAHLYGDFGKNNRQEEVWSFNIYFPSVGMTADKNSEIIIQWHAHPDQYEAARNPPLALDNRNDRLTLTWLYDQRTITPPNFKNWHHSTADLGETPKDQWVNFVFHIKWDPDGTGILRAWRNKQLKVSQQNIAIGFNDKVGPYLGFGIYKFENNSQHNQRTILFDDIKQWLIK